MKIEKAFRFTCMAAAACLASACANEAPTYPSAAALIADPTPLVATTRLSDNLWVATNANSNDLVLFGNDGPLIVDTSYHNEAKNLSSALQDFVREQSGGDTASTIILSHWHADHTEGVSLLRNSATEVWAHTNLARTMANPTSLQGLRSLFEPLGEAWEFTPFAVEDRPNRTYGARGRNVQTIRKNGETILLVHPPRAHTDGDTVVYFTRSNVVYTGDIFFNGFFPIIDRDNGGTVQGTIDAVDEIVRSIRDVHRVVPAHGALTNRARLVEYCGMLREARRLVREASRTGAGEDAVVLSAPLASLKGEWTSGLADNLSASGLDAETIEFVRGLWTDQFVRTLYRERSR